MRLLDRYLLGELLVALCYCLVGFQIFWTAFDLFGNLKEFQDLGLDWGQIARVYILRAPELLTTVLPIALLLASLYALTNLARANELIAMQAVGISLARISAPFFAVALLTGGTLFLVTEVIAPNASAKSGRLIKAGTSEMSQWQKSLDFRDDAQGQLWHIQSYNPAEGRMKRPTVDWTRNNVRTVVDAARGEWTNDTWVFYSVEKKIYDPATNDLPTLVIATNRLAVKELGGSPDQLQAEIRVSMLDRIAAAKHLQLSLKEISDYRKLHPDIEHKRAAMLFTQFHGRIAQPFTCLVVVLVALPFGTSSGRRNVFVGVAGSVGICFLYFILMRWGLALGTAGHLPAVLAAWLPNLVFAAIGLILLRRIP